MRFKHPHADPMSALLGVVAAFALGAFTTYYLGRRMMHRPRLALSAPGSDDLLREQVQKRLGELVSRPEAIQVSVEAGIVRLSGRVLSEELDSLLMRLTGMPGVYKVHNALSVLKDAAAFDEAHAPQNVSSLQP